jgi:hypothetical protein
MQISDTSKPANQVNEIAELKAKIADLEEHIHAIGFNSTLVANIFKDILNGKKPNPEFIDILNDTKFELKLIEEDDDADL